MPMVFLRIVICFNNAKQRTRRDRGSTTPEKFGVTFLPMVEFLSQSGTIRSEIPKPEGAFHFCYCAARILRKR